MHLKKPGGFDISLFYRDIINVAEDEDLGIQPKESEKLEHLMKKVRAKETKKRTLVRFVPSYDTLFSGGTWCYFQTASHFPLLEWLVLTFLSLNYSVQDWGFFCSFQGYLWMRRAEWTSFSLCVISPVSSLAKIDNLLKNYIIGKYLPKKLQL